MKIIAMWYNFKRNT